MTTATPTEQALDAGREILEAGAEALSANAPPEVLHNQFGILHQCMLLLAAGALVPPLCRRVGLSPVIGFLLVGLALGPAGLVLFAETLPPLNWLSINSSDVVHMLGEMGVVFLLFLIGLELSPARLKQMRRLVFGLGALQVGLCGLAIGAIAWLWGNSPAVALIIGGSLALSSTAIIMQLLTEERRLATPVGRGSFAVLLMQDLAAVPLLILLSLFGSNSGDSLLSLVGVALVKAGLVLVLIYYVGRWVLHPLLRFTATSEGAEPFLAAALLAVVGTAALTGMAGLSMALGAFLAGLLLADSEYSTALEIYLEPFKGLLLALFFLTVGMGLDVRAVSENFGLLLAAVIGLVLLKAGIIFALARLFGFTAQRALEMGLLLGGAGEFAFVLVGAGVAGDVIPAATGQFMLLVTGLSMLATPFLARAGQKLAHKLAPASEVPAEAFELPEALYGHVIVAGFGRVGRLLAEVLRADEIPFIVIEADGAIVQAARQEGFPVFIGNAAHPDFLERAGAGNAQSIVLTMHDEFQVGQALTSLRAHFRSLLVYARAPDLPAANRLLALGATEVTPETVEAGLQLAATVLRGIGTDDEAITQRLAMQRLRMRNMTEQKPA